MDKLRQGYKGLKTAAKLCTSYGECIVKLLKNADKVLDVLAQPWTSAGNRMEK